ncbi:translin [Anaeramoeba ignava]|uniref:Translin n=1 Tax=Anaeramoeba ignava TaxID=1746090 RepID=A0A9Q0LIR1_ANAIG|nr:translin [Anaeramoeba ignava]|eukprot:Anaeramoba_ignava/c18322_g1_i1.p1 GENE.c18322_g1_i1~~c18322_g1_i1.p1  ORF type:complete len:235 (+),score=95.78 c18322_g1_i1:2-706(+)
MEDVLLKLTENFEEENSTHEQIINSVKEIKVINAQIDFLLEKIHSKPNEMNEILNQTKEFQETLQQKYSSLFDLIPKGKYYKYYYLWKATGSQSVFLIAIIHWFENKTLITQETVKNLFHPSNKEDISQIGIDLENYLFGLIQLSNELSRFAGTFASHGKYQLVQEIQNFLNVIYNGFKCLNLKNDDLRRRFDTLKYDLKRLESIQTDIHKLKGFETFLEKNFQEKDEMEIDQK